MSMLELAARCEAAEGPDCDLDHAIHDLLGDNDGAPLYTRSIDAAMSLVPEGVWPGLQKNKGVPSHERWGVWIETDDFGLFRAVAATPALALCAAALRALATQSDPLPINRGVK